MFDQETGFRGYCVDVMARIAERLDLDYEIALQAGNTYGDAIWENGRLVKTTGMVNTVVSGVRLLLVLVLLLFLPVLLFFLFLLLSQ